MSRECQVVNCREPAAMPTRVEITAFGDLELDLCPFHEEGLDEAIETAIFLNEEPEDEDDRGAA